MIQKIKSSLLIIASAVMLGVPVAMPLAVSAATSCGSNTANKVAEGAGGALGDSSTDCNASAGLNGSGITDIASKVVDVFSIVVGVIAVIFIIYGGFRYITSGGDSGKVGNAKNTLIYAIIGLVIVALAQFIVKVVLNSTSNIAS